MTSNNEPVIDETPFPFGKHEGVSVEEVLAVDQQYVKWVLKQEWFREKFPANMEYFETAMYPNCNQIQT